MKNLFLFLVLFAGFSLATITLVPQVSKNIAIGSEVYDFGYFSLAVADHTTKTGGFNTPIMLYFDPLTNCANCNGTPSATPLGFGWETADIFNGYIDAGAWIFNMSLKNTNTQGANKFGYIGVNVFKHCNGEYTRLFYEQGTFNVLNSTLVANAFNTAVISNQPMIEMQSECRIYVGYWLNTTTGFTAGGNRLELHLGDMPNQTTVTLPTLLNSFSCNNSEMIDYLKVIGNNTYSLNSSVAYFNTTLLDIDNETDFLHNITLAINGTVTATHNDTQSVLIILDSLNVTILNASIAQLINQTYVIEDFLTQIRNMLNVINGQVLSIAGNVTQLSYQIANLTGLVQTLNITNDIIVINNSLNTINGTANNIRTYTSYTVKTNNKKNTVFCLPQQYVDWCLVV